MSDQDGPRTAALALQFACAGAEVGRPMAGRVPSAQQRHVVRGHGAAGRGVAALLGLTVGQGWFGAGLA